MKYRKLSTITDDEVNELFTKIFKFKPLKNEGIVNINRINENEVVVTIKTVWDNNLIEDEIELTSYSIETGNFSLENERHTYFQYLVARGFHYLWKDNKFIK